MSWYDVEFSRVTADEVTVSMVLIEAQNLCLAAVNCLKVFPDVTLIAVSLVPAPRMGRGGYTI